MKKQTLARVISISLALGLGAAAQANAQPSATAATGFYGGVSIRDRGTEAPGITFGPAPQFTTRFNTGNGDDVASRSSLLFGGYRWSNDLSVEASFGSTDQYALRPSDTTTARGVGLNLANGARSLTDLPSRSWNVDVVTSWSFLRSFALYGRLGYAQTDPSPLGSSPISVGDPRRLREGMNYGVGLRYDLSRSLGLKLEYSRFGRFAGEFASTLPESDQVSVGLQLRF
jgi:opacity protein-like surface antigen